MFKILEKDPRAKFRIVGQEKVDLKQFLKNLSQSDITHSSDLRKSTDAFPFDFMEQVLEGIKDYLDRDEYRAIRASISGFRIIPPTEENQQRKREARVVDIDKIVRKLSTPLQQISLNQNKFGFDIAEYKRLHPNTKYQGAIPGNPPKIVDQEEYELFYGIQPSSRRVWEELIENERKALMNKFEDEYITLRGIQMGTSASIAFLYAYNIYCDDEAKKKPFAKGNSLVCGDDAIRHGNRPYIDGYRETITELGSEFSPTKDVVGEHPRGVFTELIFQDGEILPIPKIKLVVRSMTDERIQAPEWIRSIQAMNSINSFNNKHTEILRNDMKEKYMKILKIAEPYTPLGLPPILGGVRDMTLPEHLKRVWELIKRIRKPIEALDCLRTLTRIISIEYYGR
jgi:hypothetical protein